NRRAIEVAKRRLEEAESELEVGDPSEEISAERTVAEKNAPFRRFRSSDGWLILAGRNSKENDRLLREAKGWDLWLHARDGAGAHVILKKPGKDGRVPERSLIEAAGVAAQNSKLSNDSYVEVMVVEAARVRKVKGGGPGRVHVSGERTLRVAPGAGKPKALG
ncbi:MAG: fibronectin/fibrinogen-binding protein, partial [Deltaproteobacteria bacterium]